LISHFDTIQLRDEQINEIVDYIRTHEQQEQEFIKKSQRLTNERLNLAQERISKLIDMHIDGKIDADTYHFKLEEYKREQQKLTLELKSYSGGSKEEVIAAQEVLELIQESKELFMSPNLDEKQQLLRCFYSNLELDREKLHVELREPFKTIATVQDQHIWRG